jgi:predicted nucleic acid-binding protein
MRVVLDTNILVSALMIQVGNPAAIYRAWQEGQFTLLTCAEHLDELRATLRMPAVAERIKPYKAVPGTGEERRSSLIPELRS